MSEERRGEPGRDERLRLFLALELPEDARAALVHWRAESIRDGVGLRPVAPEYLHVTLCFLGWRSADEVDPILSALAPLAVHAAPQLRLGDAIWLPPRRPRVLAVELADPEAALARVQVAASEALATGGWYTPEPRPYLGHVSLARVKRGAPAPRVVLGPPPSLAFRAPRVTFYRSRLSPGGARYESLGNVELGGG